jgi:hypothetical protein
MSYEGGRRDDSDAPTAVASVTPVTPTPVISDAVDPTATSTATSTITPMSTLTTSPTATQPVTPTTYTTASVNAAETPATAQEIYDRAMANEKAHVSTTLKDVYNTVEKWMGIREIDHDRIDVTLAVAMSNRIEGTPLWLIVVGNSGDGKTQFTKALTHLPNVIKVDQLTENTLASGKEHAHDLGSELNNAKKILIFPDLATLSSVNKDTKALIWGQFRNLYDGYICKRTGSGVNKEYENCHVTLIACSTPAIRNEILIHNALGTRELLYDTGACMEDNDMKMERALENEQHEEEMDKEIGDVVTWFLRIHKPKPFTPSNEMKRFLKNEANRLSVLRVTAFVDSQHQELDNLVYPEVPTRAIKQFVRLYRCLKSLDPDYTDERVKRIITHIVNSSGNNVRRLILDAVCNNEHNEFMKIPEIQEKTKLGRKAVKRECEILWALGVFERYSNFETVGTVVCFGQNGEYQRGGKVEEIFYYRFSENNNWFTRAVHPNSPPTYLVNKQSNKQGDKQGQGGEGGTEVNRSDDGGGGMMDNRSGQTKIIEGDGQPDMYWPDEGGDED